MEIIIIFILGALAGGLIVNVFYFRHGTAGVLRIDQSNPEKDVYRFEVYDLDNLPKKKRVLMKVDCSADLSQK